jgi:hypothetical protein
MAKKRAAAPAEKAPEQHACRRCKLLLNPFTHPDGTVTLEHARPWITDHAPEPAPFHEVDIQWICDFCSGDGPVSQYLGAATEARDAYGRLNRYNDTWMACAGCDSYLVRGDIDGLSARVRAAAQARGHVVIQNPRELWEAFLPTITSRSLLDPPRPLRPSTLPKVRDGLVRYWTGKFALGPPPRVATVAGALTDAELFWVAPTFATLAVVSGQKLRPGAQLSARALPAAAGLLVWEAPVAPMPHRPDGYADTIAASWAPRPEGGFYLTGYALAGQILPGIPVERLRADAGWLLPVHQPIRVHFGRLGDAPQMRVIDDPDHRVDAAALGRYVASLLATLMATWLLMAQPGVAESAPVEVDRSIRKAYGRAGRPQPRVRLVDLRKRPRTAAGTGKTFSYSVQFIVSGYWRDTYAGRPIDPPTFVAPYLKGPEDAPFKMPGEKVNLLR